MSEFTQTKEKRLVKLLEVAKDLLYGKSARPFILNNSAFIPTVIPSDFITLFDELIKTGFTITELKKCSNKIMNIFYKPIDSYVTVAPTPGTFLALLKENNSQMEAVLKTIRPVFRSFMKETQNITLKTELVLLLEELEVFVNQYTIKENVLFPAIEKQWPDYRCIQIMWSFHDDIRRNIKGVQAELKKETPLIKDINSRVGDLFFNMLAIKFREEKILFPYILLTISEKQLGLMNTEGAEMGYPYVQPTSLETPEQETPINQDIANLGTGLLTIKQIQLVFNHLPVDITFVDEHDIVRYFSTPKKRIFPRTNAIIGRHVSNCHPPESVHVVEQIVQSFKDGEKDKAEFWIQMRGEYILIQYFAVKDEHQNYKGVIEVTQEISDIKSIEGERRLLDW